MRSITYGEVDMKQIVDIIQKYTEKNPHGEYSVVVGTDSQNFDDTKIVVVVAVVEKGHGGIFFYDIKRVKRITNLRQKIYTETQMSLDCATSLLEEFEAKHEENGFDYEKIHFSIHVDVGENGPTKAVIPEIVGWVKSYGYDVCIKPESFVSSSVANKITK